MVGNTKLVSTRKHEHRGSPGIGKGVGKVWRSRPPQIQ